MNNLLSPEEAKQFLRVSAEELDAFVKNGKLQAYKISGQYLRFRKEDVLHLKETVFKDREHPVKQNTVWGRLRDFWKFNNFYIIGLLVAVGVIYWLTRDYFN
jgi:excisionase family DNA binding protein